MGIRLVIQSRWTTEPSPDFVYEFDQQRVTIGRSKAADVCMPHPAVSLTHATISQQGAGYAIEDEDSTNGTKVNGTPIAPRRKKVIKDGDLLELGGFRVAFRGGIAVSHTTSAEATSSLAHQMVRYGMGSETTGLIDRPRLRVIAGPDKGNTISIPVPPSEVVVGRSENADLALTDADASREHIRIKCDLSGCQVADLGSKNGLLVNDKRLESKRLRDGDELCLGVTLLRFEEPATEALRKLLESPDHRGVPEEPEPEPEPEEATSPSSSKETSPTPKPKTKTTRPAAGRTADVVIYVLAAAVLALSVLALFVLLRAS